MTYSCCYRCTKRKQNCHSDCQEYIAEKAKIEAEKAEIAQQKSVVTDYKRQKAKEMWRRRKRS